MECFEGKITSLRLPNNNLSGDIIEEWDIFKSMKFLDLSKNNISGSFPSNMELIEGLQLLDLGE